jgi:hypothetical protein
MKLLFLCIAILGLSFVTFAQNTSTGKYELFNLSINGEKNIIRFEYSDFLAGKDAQQEILIYERKTGKTERLQLKESMSVEQTVTRNGDKTSFFITGEVFSADLELRPLQVSETHLGRTTQEKHFALVGTVTLQGVSYPIEEVKYFSLRYCECENGNTDFGSCSLALCFKNGLSKNSSEYVLCNLPQNYFHFYHEQAKCGGQKLAKTLEKIVWMNKSVEPK